MDGYTVSEAASVLGVPTERVWELIARGILSGTPEGESGMRVYLQPRPGPLSTPPRRNGDGGQEAGHELSPFRELLTEFRNLTERYGQALLALGEARGEVAALRSRVDALEARIELRLPGFASSAPSVRPVTPAADPPPVPAEEAPDVPAESDSPAEADRRTPPDVSRVVAATPEVAVADEVAVELPPVDVEAVAESETPPQSSDVTADDEATDRTLAEDEAMHVESPDAGTPAAEHETATEEDGEPRQRRRRGRIGRIDVSEIAEALARAQDPSAADLPGGSEAAEAMAAFEASKPSADTSREAASATAEELTSEAASAPAEDVTSAAAGAAAEDLASAGDDAAEAASPRGSAAAPLIDVEEDAVGDERAMPEQPEAIADVAEEAEVAASTQPVDPAAPDGFDAGPGDLGEATAAAYAAPAAEPAHELEPSAAPRDGDGSSTEEPAEAAADEALVQAADELLPEAAAEHSVVDEWPDESADGGGAASDPDRSAYASATDEPDWISETDLDTPAPPSEAPAWSAADQAQGGAGLVDEVEPGRPPEPEPDVAGGPAEATAPSSEPRWPEPDEWAAPAGDEGADRGTGAHPDEEAVLWLGEDWDEEMESAPGATADRDADLPGGAELDEALAALDELGRPYEGPDQPTEPWGRPATVHGPQIGSQGPARRAYHRLRRILPH